MRTAMRLALLCSHTKSARELLEEGLFIFLGHQYKSCLTAFKAFLPSSHPLELLPTAGLCGSVGSADAPASTNMGTKKDSLLLPPRWHSAPIKVFIQENFLENLLGHFHSQLGGRAGAPLGRRLGSHPALKIKALKIEESLDSVGT